MAPTSSAASGVWTLQEAAENQGAGTWPQPTASGYEYIAGHTFSGSTSAFSFTSIPQTYESIRIIGVIKKSANPVIANIQINGWNTVSTQYKYGSVYGYGSFGIVGGDKAQLDYGINPSASVDYVVEINLEGYTNTTIITPINAQWGAGASGAVTTNAWVQNGPTGKAALTSLKYFDANGYSFAAGSTVSMFALAAS